MIPCKPYNAGSRLYAPKKSIVPPDKGSHMKRFIASIALLFAGFSPAYGITFPEHFQPLPPQSEVLEQQFSGYDFTAILALSGCSGSLIRFDDSQDGDHAMALTNGHCVRMLDPGEILVNETSSRTFDLLGQDAKKIGTLHAQRLLYAAMTKTDIGLYQLKETYADIATKYRTDALVLSRGAPQAGTAIEVISGYWKRGYSCSVEATVYSLKEGDWLFLNSLRYSRPGCDVVGGTSGSPVIEQGTRALIAINNTINESGRRCTVNNPCEVDRNGNVTYQQGNGYAQQTYWIYGCRNDQGEVDLNVAGCQLARPSAALLAGQSRPADIFLH